MKDDQMPRPFAPAFGAEETSAIDLISAERERQISMEGWTPEHDDAHNDGELVSAAICYAFDPKDQGREYLPPIRWPWDESWWKPTPNDRIRELVKAGALIVAEIERLQRAQS